MEFLLGRVFWREIWWLTWAFCEAIVSPGKNRLISIQAKNIASDIELTVSWPSADLEPTVSWLWDYVEVGASWRLSDLEPTMSWLWDYVEVGASRRWADRELTFSWPWAENELTVRLRWGGRKLTLSWPWVSVSVTMMQIKFESRLFICFSITSWTSAEHVEVKSHAQLATICLLMYPALSVAWENYLAYCTCVYVCEFITYLHNYMEIIRIIYLKEVEFFSCSSHCMTLLSFWCIWYFTSLGVIVFCTAYVIYRCFTPNFFACYFAVRHYIFVTKSVSCLGSVMKRIPGEFIVVPRNTVNVTSRNMVHLP
jgi:hypothetical protein